MLEKNPELKLSEYSKLYDLIVPQDDPLRQINELVDFSFVFDELKDKYCPDNGRNAYDPIYLFKFLLLKVYFNLSDRDVVKRAQTDLAFKLFLGLSPEDPVIDHSTLTKFRRQRLKDSDILDLLIKKSMQIAIDHKLIKSQGIIVDSMHALSRFNPHRPLEALRDQSKKLRRELYAIDEGIKTELPEKPDTNNLEDEQAYTQQLIKIVEHHSEFQVIDRITKNLNSLKEIVDDIENEKIISADKNAKIGHKTATTSFFGYKFHLGICEEGFIVCGKVTSGEKGDGKLLGTLIQQAKDNGMTVKTVIGDKAYSGKRNIRLAEAEGFKLVARMNPVISNGSRNLEDKWDFNKDAGMVVCPAGQTAIRKQHVGKKDGAHNPVETYLFDVEVCKKCPINENCYRKGAKSKSYSISIKSDEHKAQIAFEKTAYFQKEVRERYRIEQKNSELKNRYGCHRSWSNDITGMTLQGAIAVFCANLHRTLRLTEQNKG